MPNQAELATRQRNIRALSIYLARHSLKEAIITNGEKPCNYTASDINVIAKAAAIHFEGLAQAAIRWFDNRTRKIYGEPTQF